MENKMRVFGSLFLLLGVALGAFASHALENFVAAEGKQAFETAVRYLIYHGLGLLILSLMPYKKTADRKTVFYLLTLGISLFSGSIMVLVFKEMIPFSIRWIGPITLIGGTLLLVGWFWNVRTFLKK